MQPEALKTLAEVTHTTVSDSLRIGRTRRQERLLTAVPPISINALKSCIVIRKRWFLSDLFNAPRTDILIERRSTFEHIAHRFGVTGVNICEVKFGDACPDVIFGKGTPCKIVFLEFPILKQSTTIEGGESNPAVLSRLSVIVMPLQSNRLNLTLTLTLRRYVCFRDRSVSVFGAVLTPLCSMNPTLV